MRAQAGDPVPSPDGENMQTKAEGNGRVKRKSAQAAEDAQLARAIQDELMRFNYKVRKGSQASGGKGQHKMHKKPEPAVKHSCSRAQAPSEKKHKIEEAHPQLLHFLSRNPDGYLDADGRRGCCICEECAEVIAEELRTGSGVAVLRGAFSVEAAQEARNRIQEIQKGGSGVARTGELGSCHSRVWSLLNFGNPFINMVTLPVIFKIFGRVLGEDFALGSCSANDIGPGCRHGPAHVDYPYSMLKRFPEDTIACQAIFCLDEFTEENGGTQVALHSQKWMEHPDRDDELRSTVKAQPGDIIIYNSLVHHRSGRNGTDQHRIGMLCQFLAKYVRPMEEQVETLPDEIKRNASKRLKQLLALDCPFPIKEPAISGSYHN